MSIFYKERLRSTCSFSVTSKPLLGGMPNVSHFLTDSGIILKYKFLTARYICTILLSNALIVRWVDTASLEFKTSSKYSELNRAALVHVPCWVRYSHPNETPRAVEDKCKVYSSYIDWWLVGHACVLVHYAFLYSVLLYLTVSFIISYRLYKFPF